MKVLDPGHKYLLDSHDGGESILLKFVKRDSPPGKYPGNTDSYPGTLTQEVLRALIDRGEYVQNQQPCPETESFIHLMRTGLFLLESRVRRIRHQVGLDVPLQGIDSFNGCMICGHILCMNH